VTDPSGTEFLTPKDLLGLVRALGAGPVREFGLLDSACHRPRASFFGQDAYPTIASKAAALAHSLTCNHALVDGNKRLALLAMTDFLWISGYILDLADDEAFDLIMAIAEGKLDAAEVAERIRLAPVRS
jgi:death on curing protein